MTRPLIIHHGNCPDGFGAAWLMQRALAGADPEIVAAAYGDALPYHCDDRLVYIVDFCYETDQLIELCERAQAVVILDHHKTALESVVGTPLYVYDNIDEYQDDTEYRQFMAILNQDRSGIGNVLDFTNPPEFPEWMLNLEDRDLWRFALPHTAELFAAITAWPYDIDVWNMLAEMSVADLAKEGVAIEQYRQRMIESILETAHPYVLPDKTVTMAVGCAPYAVGSDVAGELAKMAPSGVGCYYIRYGSWTKYGLRSGPDGPDVAEIAARCAPGGGGHEHASGFELHLAP